MSFTKIVTMVYIASDVVSRQFQSVVRICDLRELKVINFEIFKGDMLRWLRNSSSQFEVCVCNESRQLNNTDNSILMLRSEVGQTVQNYAPIKT